MGGWFSAETVAARCDFSWDEPFNHPFGTFLTFAVVRQ